MEWQVALWLLNRTLVSHRLPVHAGDETATRSHVHSRHAGDEAAQPAGGVQLSAGTMGLVDLALGLGARAVPSTPSRVLLLQVPSQAAMARQPVLLQLKSFDEALRRLNGGGLVPDGRLMAAGDLRRHLLPAWHRCLKMVRNNKCTAVC